MNHAISEMHSSRRCNIVYLNREYTDEMFTLYHLIDIKVFDNQRV